VRRPREHEASAVAPVAAAPRPCRPVHPSARGRSALAARPVGLRPGALRIYTRSAQHKVLCACLCIRRFGRPCSRWFQTCDLAFSVREPPLHPGAIAAVQLIRHAHEQTTPNGRDCRRTRLPASTAHSRADEPGAWGTSHKEKTFRRKKARVPGPLAWAAGSSAPVRPQPRLYTTQPVTLEPPDTGLR
jgi:hypothetical protein